MLYNQNYGKICISQFVVNLNFNCIMILLKYELLGQLHALNLFLITDKLNKS